MTASCSGNPNSADHGQGQAHSSDTAAFTEFNVQTVASGLNHPWGMAFLPDERLLVTERSGNLRILDKNNHLSSPVAGVPKVFNEGQGGLLDVALSPTFSRDKLVYLSFSEPGAGETASTALGYGTLEGYELKNFKVIFSQKPKVSGGNHFGSRILFSSDGKLFLTLGERFQFEPAQDLAVHLGKIIRINPDGSIPADNPFHGREEVQPEIWSYGHRNIEAAAFNPADGKLWIAEMGPLGGDELNQPLPGKNYGWPLVSWGKHYDGRDIADPPTRPDFEDAKIHWTPVISPSGMIFYSGKMFTQLQNNMLIGGLSAKGIIRVEINDNQAREIGRIDLKERIRDIEQASDGSLYVLTDQDNGKILRLTAK